MKTVVLKLSGDALRDSGGLQQSFDARDEIITIRRVDEFSFQIAEALSARPDLRVAIVVGGGNILRGREMQDAGMADDVLADHMGMLATVINSIALKDSLRRANLEPRVMSGLDTRGVAEPYVYERALKHLDRGRVVVFAGGTGNPYVTTDSAAAQRARELGAEVLLVAKNGTDGVYDMDPNAHAGARRFKTVTFKRMIESRLQVMDAHAVQTCLDGKVPLFVFDIDAEKGLYRALVEPHPEFGTWVISADDAAVEFYSDDLAID